MSGRSPKSCRHLGPALALLFATPLSAVETKLIVTTPSSCVAPVFGWAVAIAGEAVEADRLIVGSPGYDLSTPDDTDRGGIYIFEFGAAGWTETVQMLYPEIPGYPPQYGARFGHSVAMWGDYALAGAPYLHVKVGAHTYEDAGGSRLLVREGWGDWSGPGDMRFGQLASTNRGMSVAVHDNTAYFDGAPGFPVDESQRGAVQVSELVGGVWWDGPNLVAPDGGGGFGESVTAWVNRIAVGAPSDSHTLAGAGAVYVFEKVGGDWTFEQKLTASDLAVGDHFGSSVSLAGNYLAVGAPGKNGWRGRVYVFVLSGGVWSQVANLSASDGESGDSFGLTVASWDPYLVVGASGDDDNGEDAGAVYGFRRLAAGYTQVGKRNAGDGWPHDEYGNSVSIYNGDFAVGSPYTEVNGKAAAGAVYLYDWTDLAGHLFSDGFERGNHSRWSAHVP